VSESFDPYWSFEPTGEGQMSYRIGSLVFVFSIGYYIANQVDFFSSGEGRMK
jgi:hypothetical protein